MKKILFIAAIALLSGCETAPQGVQERALELPGLVALWDFGGENGLKAVGAQGFTLEPVEGIDTPALEAYGFPKDATESDIVARLFKMYQELTTQK